MSGGAMFSTSVRRISVLLVDDSATIRERLFGLLNEVDGVDVVGQAADAQEGVEAVRALEPDVVILDVRMPGGGGFHFLKELRASSLAPTVIVLTNYPYSGYRKRAAELGAAYFYDKATEFQRVVELLGELSAGGEETPGREGP